MRLVFNISSNYIGGDFVTYTTNEVTVIPQFPRPQLLSQFREFLEYLSRRYTFHYLNYLRRRILRGYFNKYVNMIFHYFHSIYIKVIMLSYLIEYLFQVTRYPFIQYVLPIFRYPYNMIFQIVTACWVLLIPMPLLYQLLISVWQLISSPTGELLSSPQQTEGYSAGFLYKGT